MDVGCCVLLLVCMDEFLIGEVLFVGGVLVVVVMFCENVCLDVVEIFDYFYV